MKTLTKSVIVLTAILMTGCANMRVPAGGTETGAELCRQWGKSLPTRSRQDTQQTSEEIQEAYAAFSLSCPEWAHLIP